MAQKRKAADDVKPPPAKKTDTKPKTAAGRKRKAVDTVEAPAKKVKALTHGPAINQVPGKNDRLHVYVFGEGGQGELGLGNVKKPPTKDVKRPRENPFLSVEKVGVYRIVAGGMHAVAVTFDNKVLTWGVNDQGALGRDTEWDGGLKDMDAASVSSDDSDDGDNTNGLNPLESTPGEVDWTGVELAPGTIFTEVAAGDSCSFVLTDDGKVYGWGTFRGNDGIIGFTPEIKIATRPVLIKGLKDIKKIVAGSNHCFALDNRGRCYSWGSGQQDQLGRRVIERTAKSEGLKPREFGLPRSVKNPVVAIGSGSYHGYAITEGGDVYGWGLNSFGQTGVRLYAGDDDATIRPPRRVESLSGRGVKEITGGEHHGIACTQSGDCLVWGRVDGHQMGIADEELAKLPEEAVRRDPRGKIRIVIEPQKVTAINDKVKHVAAGSDHNVAISFYNGAYSWGFSANYQTGQGTDDDIIVATQIDNSAVRGHWLDGASCGGQFSILTRAAYPVDVSSI